MYAPRSHLAVAREPQRRRSTRYRQGSGRRPESLVYGSLSHRNSHRMSPPASSEMVLAYVFTVGLYRGYRRLSDIPRESSPTCFQIKSTLITRGCVVARLAQERQGLLSILVTPGCCKIIGILKIFQRCVISENLIS